MRCSTRGAEFTTYRAYWIAPAAVNGEYRVLYLEFDEAPGECIVVQLCALRLWITAVHVFNIANPGLEGTVDPFRYALAGTKNSTIRVMLASLHKVRTVSVAGSLCLHTAACRTAGA